MQDRKETLARRTWLGGAATAGAAAVAASLMPARTDPVAEVAKPATLPAEGAKGYQLTEHVKHYYAKARI